MLNVESISVRSNGSIPAARTANGNPFVQGSGGDRQPSLANGPGCRAGVLAAGRAVYPMRLMHAMKRPKRLHRSIIAAPSIPHGATRLSARQPRVEVQSRDLR